MNSLVDSVECEGTKQTDLSNHNNGDEHIPSIDEANSSEQSKSDSSPSVSRHDSNIDEDKQRNGENKHHDVVTTINGSNEEKEETILTSVSLEKLEKDDLAIFTHDDYDELNVSSDDEEECLNSINSKSSTNGVNYISEDGLDEEISKSNHGETKAIIMDDNVTPPSSPNQNLATSPVRLSTMNDTLSPNKTQEQQQQHIISVMSYPTDINNQNITQIQPNQIQHIIPSLSNGNFFPQPLMSHQHVITTTQATPSQQSHNTNHSQLRRSIQLRLYEDIQFLNTQDHHGGGHPTEDSKKSSILSHIRKYSNSFKTLDGNSSTSTSNVMNTDDGNHNQSTQNSVPTKFRGVISVSWYEGTTALELYNHVEKSMKYKLSLNESQRIESIRIMDETCDPHQEIVLSPYIPNGSNFTIKFTIQEIPSRSTKKKLIYYKSDKSGAPHSPSEAPSIVDSEYLERIQHQIQDALNSDRELLKKKSITKEDISSFPELPPIINNISKDTTPNATNRANSTISEGTNTAIASTISEDNRLLVKSLENLNEWLSRLDGNNSDSNPPVEKRQVVFTVANYFVLFLSLIAISAEIHQRAPKWLDWIQEKLSSVHDCASDRDTLFECVSSGDISGLFASIVLWATKSVATRRLFLFGFDSPQKLWNAVYEALVSAFCWGVSYIFIRRGLNPDTRENFLTKYWKDAVYGGLSGFNAAFMKAVLKNLIPQDQVYEVLEQADQLTIVKMMGSIFSKSKKVPKS